MIKYLDSTYKKIYLVIFLLLTNILVLNAYTTKKREFRGAWIQCVNGQFQGLPIQKIQKMLITQLDKLQQIGVNAIIFQVRAECDALYQSKYEPWSRFLTGKQGTPPNPYWDPLQWMIEQCHKRGMELHAWINPYRAKTKTTKQLAISHIAIQKPERIFEYDGQYILNPGLPENADYICKIAEDIISRYDVDGFHIDDYFYPYPVAGKRIPDIKEFSNYGGGFGLIQDWRRDNVDRFIKKLYETVHRVKPWVKFGVSPFGIYRNQKNAPNIGSKTFGLQNYDDLYADVLKWINNGWVDYCVPQLYWEIGNKVADYKELINWWNRYAGNRPLYIGEDVLRTAKAPDLKNPKYNQLPAKHYLHQKAENVQGTVLWYAASVVNNPGNYANILKNNYWRTPALQPLMPFIDDKAPKKPRRLKIKWTHNGCFLTWKAPKAKKWSDEAVKYVVYKFRKGEIIDIEDPSKIESITYNNAIHLNYQATNIKYKYVVTAIDRAGNESKPKKKSVKL